MVIDKPAGLAAHPGPATDESLELYLPLLGKHPAKPPVSIHRLDRDTSGCLMLALTRGALHRMALAFEAREVGKLYWAVVDGTPPAATGSIDLALAKRSSAKAGWRMEINRNGQSARTDYEVMETRGTRSLLALRPQTGRTHQLRVHLAHIGCPIVGDVVYGRASREPLKLHARALSFTASDGSAATVTAEPPMGYWDRSA